MLSFEQWKMLWHGSARNNLRRTSQRGLTKACTPSPKKAAPSDAERSGLNEMKLKAFPVLFLLLASAAFAAPPTVEIKPSSQSTSRSNFAEDQLDLVLRKDGAITDTHYFYSSYGSADVELVQDRKGTYFAILRHGEGRGTHVRSEYITVFKIINKLNKLVTFPLNGPAGFTSDWKYSYVLSKPETGGLEFRFSLQVSGGDAIAYPEDKQRTISVK